MVRPRFSLAGSMLAVLIASLGMASLRDPGTWAGAVSGATICALTFAIMAARYASPERREWWFGFAAIGIGTLALLTSLQITHWLHFHVMSRFSMPSRMWDASLDEWQNGEYYRAWLDGTTRIVICLASLVAGSLGGLVTQAVARRSNRDAVAENPAPVRFEESY